MMKKQMLCAHVVTAIFAVSGLGITPATAQANTTQANDSGALKFVQYDRDHDRGRGHDRDDDHGRGRGHDRDDDHGRGRWNRGDRLPRDYWGHRYEFARWRDAHLYAPPPGATWLLINGQFILARPNGEILRVVIAPDSWVPDRPRDDWRARWESRYHRVYTMQEDPYYAECRSQPDPAGALVGAVIGGLLGNAAGGRRDQGAATFAGIIAGGAIGASLTSKMSCEDRSYAYRTYAQGFGAGRANASYEWRNPDNGDYGRFKVLDYYEDEDNFRCAVYNQTVYIGGRPQEAHGRACQQPDGTWAIID
jgi:Ni/Co efflux regulator RcnB/surface antigen